MPIHRTIIDHDAAVRVEAEPREPHYLEPYAPVPYSWFEKWYMSRMPAAHLRVAMQLCKMVNRAGNCFPGVRFLADATGLKERSV